MSLDRISGLFKDCLFGKFENNSLNWTFNRICLAFILNLTKLLNNTENLNMYL